MTRPRDYMPKISAASVRKREQAEREAAAEAEMKRLEEEKFNAMFDEIDRIMKIRLTPKVSRKPKTQETQVEYVPPIGDE